MTSLEQFQRGLLDLIKSRPVPGDPYLERAAASREIEILREIAVWWRVFQIEAQCHFTSRMLKRLGCFHETVALYFSINRTSPFVEELSRDFLRWVHLHHDPFVRLVADFELALLEVRAGSSEQFQVRWDRHPDLFFQSLESGAEFPAAETDCLYHLILSRDLPGMVACMRAARTQIAT